MTTGATGHALMATDCRSLRYWPSGEWVERRDVLAKLLQEAPDPALRRRLGADLRVVAISVPTELGRLGLGYFRRARRLLLVPESTDDNRQLLPDELGI